MPTWIRVKDDVTGDEYDVEETSLRRGMTPIEGYPENSGPAALPRPPKPLVGKDGLVPALREEVRANGGDVHVALGESPKTPDAPAATEGRGKKKTDPAEPADTTKEN